MMGKNGWMFGVVAAMTDARRAARKLSLLRVWKRSMHHRHQNENSHSELRGARTFFLTAISVSSRPDQIRMGMMT
jgi:hypothetical protein